MRQDDDFYGFVARAHMRGQNGASGWGGAISFGVPSTAFDALRQTPLRMTAKKTDKDNNKYKYRGPSTA
jgi:hypothetical protein